MPGDNDSEPEPESDPDDVRELPVGRFFERLCNGKMCFDLDQVKETLNAAVMDLEDGDETYFHVVKTKKNGVCEYKLMYRTMRMPTDRQNSHTVPASKPSSHVEEERERSPPASANEPKDTETWTRAPKPSSVEPSRWR